MSSYNFDLLKDGAPFVDRFGDDLSSFEDARLLARSILADVALDAMRDGDHQALACEVRTSDSRLLFRGELTYRGTPASMAPRVLADDATEGTP